ncbi:GntR family transcriptional regulator [Amycolatopsis jejuensis]|uniref:GntR family transcriptional regulator n=1 Tax=Amycolatopsis jejuensis TaxID=330084 RepID=UPI0012E0863A|nr:GntR family transcriptional regulator [Amycolatopsis jejuensis]
MAMVRTLKAQAAAALREIIRDEYRPGDRLPPEAKLAERIGVSRNTAREALADLVVEGLVERKWGVGTIVRERTGPVTVSLNEILSFQQVIDGHGHEATLAHAAVEPMTSDEGLEKLFDIAPGTALWLVERVFAVDGTPAVLIRDYASTHYHDEEFDPRSLVDVGVSMLDVIREQTGQRIARLQGALDPVLADGTTVALLEVPAGFPLVRVKQACLSAHETVLLHTEVYYRTDVITLGLNRVVRG